MDLHFESLEAAWEARRRRLEAERRVAREVLRGVELRPAPMPEPRQRAWGRLLMAVGKWVMGRRRG